MLNITWVDHLGGWRPGDASAAEAGLQNLPNSTGNTCVRELPYPAVQAPVRELSQDVACPVPQLLGAAYPRPAATAGAGGLTLPSGRPRALLCERRDVNRRLAARPPCGPCGSCLSQA